jgi:Ni,Fe-hydrogenase III large subunit
MDRLIARFVQYNDNDLELVDVFENEVKKELIKDNQIETISKIYPTARWFERKIKDDFGVQINNAYDNRVLVHHERFPAVYPMKKDFNLKEELKEVDFLPYHYEVVGGDGVFNVSVGPIHAGIIEPGHFHFSQAGEQILHLEVRHFYKYRGIEKMSEGKTLKNIQKIVSRISGNESIAYQSALQNIVGMSKNHKLQNAILLELERLVHHFTDIGFIPNDAGFGAALALGSKYAEDTKRILNLISGSRFGFDSVYKSLHVEKYKQDIEDYIARMSEEIEWFEKWINDIPSLWDRMDTTGIITKEEALNYGCVGVVARCCGISEDVRSKDEFYKKFGFEIALEQSGDVSARFKIRLFEIKNSLLMIKNMLNDLESFEIEKSFTCKDGEYSSFVESSIGELYMYIKLKDGLIERFYVRDPSFINWQALHLMMPRDIIADFPLINKSCDLSYAGSDL